MLRCVGGSRGRWARISTGRKAVFWGIFCLCISFGARVSIFRWLSSDFFFWYSQGYVKAIPGKTKLKLPLASPLSGESRQPWRILTRYTRNAGEEKSIIKAKRGASVCGIQRRGLQFQGYIGVLKGVNVFPTQELGS